MNYLLIMPLENKDSQLLGGHCGDAIALTWNKKTITWIKRLFFLIT